MNFTSLEDTFPNYVNLGGKPVLVKEAEDGLEAAWPQNVFLDNFDDDSLFWTWRTDETDANRTIVESGDVLTISVASGTDGNWWSSLNKTPKIITGLRGFPSEFICKINSGTFPTESQAGMYVAYNAVGIGANFALTYARGIAGLAVVSLGSNLDFNLVDTLPIWLRIRSSSRVKGTGGGRHIFSYSINGTDWTDQYTVDTYAYEIFTVGLFAKNWGSFPAVSIVFEFFSMSTSGGPR